MNLRIAAYVDRVRSSLFWVPVLFVIAGLALGQLAIRVDQRVELGPNLPLGFGSTVDSARAVLSTIAGATISFAGVAFSISVLVIQLASSQYSPRVVHGLFRDPFTKRVMGIVVGTFTYCLVVLRAVRGPLEEAGTPVVPNIAVAVSVLFGLIAILSIVGFINHSAHSMDISKILHRVTREAIKQVERLWVERTSEGMPERMEVPEGDGFAILLHIDGWVQQIDEQALLRLLEPGAVLRLDTAAGRYAIKGTPLGTLWPTPQDPDALLDAVRGAIVVGQTRTMQQDVSYGVRQLADVALKAMSPGVNDPTTAQDAMFHLGSLLQSMLIRRLPDRRTESDDGAVVLLPEGLTHTDLIGLAFDEVRIASAAQPTVCIYLLEILHLLDRSVTTAGVDGAAAAVREQARLVLASASSEDLLAHDQDRVAQAFADRFANG